MTGARVDGWRYGRPGAPTLPLSRLIAL